MILPAKLERYGHINVLRDDLLPGGSKTRFLPALIGDAKEIVYGGPFCGGAAWALSVIGKEQGRKITLFYAKRKEWHPRQIKSRDLGANIIELSPGYLTNVQAKARAYAAEAGALFLPLGFDVLAAEAVFVESMLQIRADQIGAVDQVWCATGSGMLARCLAKAWPEAKIFGVAVGLQSRWEAQDFPLNVSIQPSGYAFHDQINSYAPFPCCPNYDRKAWRLCSMQSRGRVLFWNVAG